MDKTAIKYCPKHGLTEHFLAKNNYYRCKKCRIDAVNKRRRKLKEKLVEYKGGKCEICGYNKSLRALHFHHINPTDKSFTIGEGNTCSFNTLKKEVDKCILVCSNCHAELHDKEEEEKIEEHDKNVFELFSKHGFKNKRIDTQLIVDNTQILNDLKEKKAKSYICKKYNISLSALKRIAEKYDLYYIETKPKVEIDRETLFSQLRNLRCFTKIAKIYGISYNALIKRCKKMNLPSTLKDLKKL